METVSGGSANKDNNGSADGSGGTEGDFVWYNGETPSYENCMKENQIIMTTVKTVLKCIFLQVALGMMPITLTKFFICEID